MPGGGSDYTTTSVAGAEVVINKDGRFTFDPRFAAIPVDNNLGTATVTVNITGLNDFPQPTGIWRMTGSLLDSKCDRT